MLILPSANQVFFQAIIPGSSDSGSKLDTAYIEFANSRRVEPMFGRQNKTTSPDGTITKTDFDFQDNAVKTWVGTADQNLVLVAETEYGDAGVCSCCTGQKKQTPRCDPACR
jgi:hypothetical protein